MDELIAMIKEIGLPYVYSCWAQGEFPGTPYIYYMTSSTHPFRVDGRFYHDFMEVDLELYSDT